MMFSRIQSAPRSSNIFLENTPNASPAWLNNNVVQRGSGALKLSTSVLSSVASAASMKAAKSPAWPWMLSGVVAALVSFKLHATSCAVNSPMP